MMNIANMNNRGNVCANGEIMNASMMTTNMNHTASDNNLKEKSVYGPAATPSVAQVGGNFKVGYK